MFRSLAGPYRMAYIIFLSVTVLISVTAMAFDLLGVGSPLFGPGTVAALAPSLILATLGLYFVFRTGSAHWVRVRQADSRMDIIGPISLMTFWLTVMLGVLFLSGEIVDRLAMAVPILMILMVWGFGVAGRKLTELRGMEPNFGATLGWGIVHFYWILGFFLLLKPTRLDGPDIKFDHP